MPKNINQNHLVTFPATLVSVFVPGVRAANSNKQPQIWIEPFFCDWLRIKRAYENAAALKLPGLLIRPHADNKEDDRWL